MIYFIIYILSTIFGFVSFYIGYKRFKFRKIICNEWSWGYDGYIDSLEKGLPNMNSWNVSDPVVRKPISADSIRTKMQIGAYSGFHIPPSDSDVWYDLGLSNDKLQAQIMISCTQLLWGTVMEKYYQEKNAQFTDFNLSETRDSVRHLQVTQGTAYSMISMDATVMGYDEPTHVWTVVFLVRIKWSLLNHKIDGCDVKYYETKSISSWLENLFKKQYKTPIIQSNIWDNRYNSFTPRKIVYDRGDL